MTEYIESNDLSLYEPIPEVKDILEIIDPNNLPNRQRIIAVLIMLVNENRGENYKYFVEGLDDGRRVFLKRPGQLNKGFDFTVNLEEFPDNPPSHDQMFSDYYLKREEDVDSFEKLEEALNEVYEGINPNTVYEKYSPFNFTKGLKTETFLKVVAWLFIEQDIRYWYGNGRARTKGGFDNLSPDEDVLENYRNSL